MYCIYSQSPANNTPGHGKKPPPAAGPAHIQFDRIIVNALFLRVFILCLPCYTAPIMTKPVKSVKLPRPENFEAALSELERIVAEMEAGQLPLEALLLTHKRGTELLQFCQSRLQDARQQVRILEADTLKNFSPPPSGINEN